MKTKFLPLTAAALLTLSLTACSQSANQNPSTVQQQQNTQTNQQQNAQVNQQSGQSTGIISLEEASKIALEAVPGAASENLYITAEIDDGRSVYEGKIIYNSTEYDFEIDAASGNIIKWEEEFVQQPVQNQSLPNQSAQPGQSTAVISLEEASKIALEAVPGASNEHLRITAEIDDGRSVYEGKIIYNSTEYDFEIDAATGKILNFEQESIFD